jgi:hypothetical protein
MRLATVLALIASVAVSTVASAQDYPVRPIRLIVPYSAGGPADVVARVLGQRLSAILGQAFVVENRGGAGGSIAGRAVATSDPDGYTLLFGATGPLVISPLVFKLPDYDPSKSPGAGCPGRNNVEHPGDQSGDSRPFSARADRLRQGQSGKAVLFLAGSRHAAAYDWRDA